MFLDMRKLESLVKKCYKKNAKGILIGNTGERYVIDGGSWRVEVVQDSYMPNDAPAMIYKYAGLIPKPGRWWDCMPESMQQSVEIPFDYPKTEIEYKKNKYHHRKLERGKVPSLPERREKNKDGARGHVRPDKPERPGSG